MFVAMTMVMFCNMAYAQNERTLSFERLEALPNGSVAVDAGFISSGSSQQTSFTLTSSTQPALIEIVSLTVGAELNVYIGSGTGSNRQLRAKTGRDGIFSETVTGEGEITIRWAAGNQDIEFGLMVFMRDPLPPSQPIFTRQSEDFDPNLSFRPNADQDPGLFQRLFDAINGTNTQGSSGPTIDYPSEGGVARDGQMQCTVGTSSFEGKTPEQIDIDLKEIQERDELNNLASGAKHLSEALTDFLAVSYRESEREGSDPGQGLVNGLARSFASKALKSGLATSLSALQTYGLIMDASGRCTTQLGFKMPRLPISHPQGASHCRDCYEAAYRQIERSINELARVQCVYGLGKEIRDAARTTINSAASTSPLVLPQAMIELENINNEFDSVVYGPAVQRYEEELRRLESGLQALSTCESDWVGFHGWYERFGFSFQLNMASAYQIKHD